MAFNYNFLVFKRYAPPEAAGTSRRRLSPICAFAIAIAIVFFPRSRESFLPATTPHTDLTQKARYVAVFCGYLMS